MSHTQTPWEVVGSPTETVNGVSIYANGRLVACVFGGNAVADAQHIVRSVNSHRGVLEAMEVLVMADEWFAANKDCPHSALSHFKWAAERARVVLANLGSN